MSSEKPAGTSACTSSASAVRVCCSSSSLASGSACPTCTSMTRPFAQSSRHMQSKQRKQSKQKAAAACLHAVRCERGARLDAHARERLANGGAQVGAPLKRLGQRLGVKPTQGSVGNMAHPPLWPATHACRLTNLPAPERLANVLGPAAKSRQRGPHLRLQRAANLCLALPRRGLGGSSGPRAQLLC